MKVVSHFHFKELRWDLAPEDLARLGAKFPNVDFVSVEDPAKLHGELADADVFVGFGVPRDAFLAAKRLRWVQSVWAGIEENLFPEMVDSEVILTNGAGLHAVSIPEHVVGQMLVLARNFHEAMRLQAKHTLLAACSEEELAAVERSVLSSFEKLAGGADRSMSLDASCHFLVARRARRGRCATIATPYCGLADALRHRQDDAPVRRVDPTRGGPSHARAAASPPAPPRCTPMVHTSR